ncbi:MAG: hypothetical protein ACR2OH_02410, partial [Microthrixaceae bacterium]
MANASTKPKGALVAAVVCLVLSLAGCGYAAVSSGALLLDSVRWLADIVDNLEPNVMGEQVNFTADGDRSTALVSVETTCVGTGPDGEVRFEGYESFSSSTTVSSSGEDFNGYMSFDSADGATYQITCGQAGQGTFIVLAEPGFLDDLGSLRTAGLAAGGGVLLFVLSIILFIVGLVRRSSWKKRNQGPPPGAYGA